MKDLGYLKNIPDEIKNNCVWCTWDLNKKGKIPYNPISKEYVRPNDSNTFCKYTELLPHLANYDGIGIGIFNEYSAIDIDDCIDENGLISDMAEDIIKYCNSYTEYSPSKKGIRIIFKTHTELDKSRYYIHNSKLGLEIYISGNTNKFVSITGNTLNINNKVETLDITDILNKYMMRYSDLESAILKDVKFSELWNKMAPGSGADESECDLALCNKLAFYLKGNYPAIDEAFKKSPYYLSKDEYHKKKWEREDYKSNTINTAIRNTMMPVVNNSNTQKYTLSDTGNAHRFIDMFKGDILYNVDNKQWMIYNGKYWQTDYLGQVRERIELLAEELKMEIYNCDNEALRKNMSLNYKRVLNTAGKNSLLTEASVIKGIPVLNNSFDSEPYLLCCNNGVIDLRTGEIKPFDKSLMLSQFTNYDVDMENDPILFIKFLNEIFEGDQERIHYIHKVFGYSASNIASEQEMYLLYGDGSNGKSLLLEIMHDILGEYSIVANPTLLTENFGSANQNLGQVARLKGKRLVCVEELDPGEKAKESLIKSLTSGFGNIVGKFLYANEFEFSFKGKIIQATNYLLNITGTDKGIWRRIKVIPFNATFEEKNKDKKLKDKLMKEAPQILGWIVKGFMKYWEEGLVPPKIVTDQIEAYKEEMDVIQQWVKECCSTSDKQAISKASELYQNFVFWSRKNNQPKILSNTLFGKNLCKKFNRKQLSNGKVYIGIKLRDDNNIPQRDMAWENTKVPEDI